MKGETINIIDNLINAISILNKTDEYLESLDNRLSEYDSLNSDFEHFIEFTPIDKVDLKKLYEEMQDMYKKRRKVKNDMTINKNYKNNIGKLQEHTNREFLIQTLKNIDTRNDDLKYSNRVLSKEEIENLLIVEHTKKGRGRPKKSEV